MVQDLLITTVLYCQERLSVGRGRGLVHTEQFKGKNCLIFFVPHSVKGSIQQHNKFLLLSVLFLFGRCELADITHLTLIN